MENVESTYLKLLMVWTENVTLKDMLEPFLVFLTVAVIGHFFVMPLLDRRTINKTGVTAYDSYSSVYAIFFGMLILPLVWFTGNVESWTIASVVGGVFEGNYDMMLVLAYHLGFIFWVVAVGIRCFYFNGVWAFLTLPFLYVTHAAIFVSALCNK